MTVQADGFHAGVGPSFKRMAEGKSYVNPGLEDQMEIYGYRLSRLKQTITWIFIVATLGLLRLVFHWKPEWMLKCTHKLCAIALAETVLLKDQYDEWFVEKVKVIRGDGEVEVLSSAMKTRSGSSVQNSPTKDKVCHRFFTNKKIKYTWNDDVLAYKKLGDMEKGRTCRSMHESPALTEEERNQQRLIYGENSIVIHVTPILKILFTQILNPFYVFQIFSVILWFFDEYYYYASCIIIISALSLTMSIREIRMSQRALKSRVKVNGNVTQCTLNSNNVEEYKEVAFEELVPGDIIEIPRHGCPMFCDAVLLSGNCIVNESMLTGESVPVMKTPLPNPQDDKYKGQLFDIKEHSRHLLFCGTNVIQTRYYGSQKVRAVVVRTGFSTAKGELVRAIMFPKPIDFKFSQDSFKFIGVLAVIASVGMLYTLILMSLGGDRIGHIIVRTLDIITIVVPPALPAAMTVGSVCAQRRLRRALIYCISPRFINQCGAINVFCFDKTGTLTEDGMDMWGVVPVENSTFKAVEKETEQMDNNSKIVTGMASCHSLTLIEGEISGDPLDLKMFQATGWDLEEPGEDTSRYDMIMPTVVRPQKPDLIKDAETYTEKMPVEIGILRQFTFSSRLQRMSVITRRLDARNFELYAKGAPEMIASLCKPNTVPVNYHEVLMQYTQLGYRVIALAYSPLKMSYVKIMRAQREQVERDLIFLGLLVMENRLKEETEAVIRTLKLADLRTVMVTGDNMLTALSVARDCGMIEKTGKVILAHVVPPIGSQDAQLEWAYAEDAHSKVTEIYEDTTKSGTVNIQIEDSEHVHLAITGKSWDLVRKFFPEVISKLAVKGTVFARMSPDQKMQLIEVLQDVGYYVGMCGDGANDCGALKMAHTGISLSETEASVASPFTSKVPDISCVPTTIREGRAALVTSFAVFKYMACYSLTEFVSICILYWIGAILSDFGFLWIDLFLLTTLSVTFSYTGAHPDLVPTPPPISLISLLPILSIVFQMIIIVSVQVFAWFWVQEQPWFEPLVADEEDSVVCHQVTMIYLISSFQYITLAVVLSKGAPYRQPIYANKAFVINLVICTLATAYMTLYPGAWLIDLMEMMMPPSHTFRWLMVAVAAGNFLVCALAEMLVDSDRFQNFLRQLFVCLRHKETKYESIEARLLDSKTDWPPPKTSTNRTFADIIRLESMSSQLNLLDFAEELAEEQKETIQPRKKSRRRRTSSSGSKEGQRRKPKETTTLQLKISNKRDTEDLTVSSSLPPDGAVLREKQEEEESPFQTTSTENSLSPTSPVHFHISPQCSSSEPTSPSSAERQVSPHQDSSVPLLGDTGSMGSATSPREIAMTEATETTSL